ncbi:hypothetical protein ID866_11481 [Astraeus odoratus]|nr:hypothetical protein ID866_11481 [Astraeus odoratus]
MKSVHLVFHISQLKPTTPNVIPNHIQLPLPPVEVDGDPKYKISEILNSKGTDEETSWLLATKLDHSSELVQEYHAWNPAKPGPQELGKSSI